MAVLKVLQEPLYTSSGAVFPDSSELRRKFTYKSRFGDLIKLYKQLPGKRVMLPRGVCKLGEDRRVWGEDVRYHSSFKARNEEQSRVVGEAVSRLEQGQSFLIQAPTGFGKTAVTMEIIARVGKVPYIVVTKSDVENQWRDALKKFLNLSANDIGTIRGDIVSVSAKKAILVSLQSAYKADRYPDWIFRAGGMLIVDEVHRIGADLFSQAIWNFPQRLRVGLSATITRKDGKDIVFRQHIGPIAVESEAIPMLPTVLRQRFVAPVLGKIPHSRGRISAVLKPLSRMVERNRAIARFVKDAYDQGRNTVVFADTIEMLQRIEESLILARVPIGALGWYVGGLSKGQQEAAKVQRVVLATYKMCSEATDAPWWDTCVLASPKADVQQIVGRVLREYPDKKQPVVFDIIDVSSGVLQMYARSRLRWYEEIGAYVKELS